jgi:hypothetical protein
MEAPLQVEVVEGRFLQGAASTHRDWPGLAEAAGEGVDA